jgi:hypothetical protein
LKQKPKKPKQPKKPKLPNTKKPKKSKKNDTGDVQQAVGAVMSWEPRVGGHVAYIRDIVEATETFPVYVTDYVKRRPAIITAVNVGDTVDLRVGHHGETYAAVPRRTSDEQTEVYVPY